MKIKSKNGETLNFLYSGVKGVYVLDHIAFKAMFDEEWCNDWEKSTGKKKLQEWARKNLPTIILERFDVDLPTVEEVFSQKTLNLDEFGRELKSKQFPILQNSDNRMMEFDGEPFWWWTRSANPDWIVCLWSVYKDGNIYYTNAGDMLGFVPVLRSKEEKQMTDYSKYTDAELRQVYKDRYEEYKTWWNSQDGSDGAFWDHEIRPIYEEARKRGVDL